MKNTKTPQKSIQSLEQLEVKLAKLKGNLKELKERTKNIAKQ